MKLQIFILFLAVSFLSCNKQDIQTGNPGTSDSTVTNSNNIAHPDHIIFVWFENKNYSTVIDSSYAPYIHSLVGRGTLFTNSSAITHPSYPNYIDFFAGDPNGVLTDKCIDSAFSTPNLYTNLNSVGKSFAWYSEGLPEAGSKVCNSVNYYAKHNPTTIFANVPATASKPFSSFPTDYTQLENVVCISPDINNDMHNGALTTAVAMGDKWLKTNLSSLIDWCTTHNSIFVVYFDENEEDILTPGNLIPVVAVGEHVKVNYKDSAEYDHYNWTRTICDMFSAPKDWTTNLSSRTSINTCWK